MPGSWLRRVCHGGVVLLFLLLMLAWRAGAAPQFDAALDRDTISLGEAATLTLTCKGANPSSQPTLPPINGIRAGSTGQEMSQEIINGRISSSVIYSFELQPTRVGEFTIPAVVADVSGARLVTHPLKLKVVQGAPPPVNNGAPPTAFVRLIPSSTNIYLGQVVRVEVQCYCTGNVGNIQMPQFTSDNFILGTMPNNPDRSHSRQGNNIYNMFNFRVTATATRTGLQPLGPVTWSMTEGFGQQDIFGRFMSSRPLTVTSDAPEIQVSPVPTNGAPPTFHGTIGQFTLAQYEAGPVAVGVGDPITLKIRISGSGSFDTLTLPSNEQDWREFKTYPATSKLESTDPMQIQGSKYFEQVITPLNAEIKELPAFAFSFFDPGSGTFRTLNHAPIPLSIHATAATPQPTVVASSSSPPEAQPQNQDIVHIKPLAGAVGMPAPPLVLQPFFLTWQALPPLLWVGALLWRRQKDRLANNPRLRRRREVAAFVRKGLADLPAHAFANDTEKFHAAVLRLLQEQLGERLDLPAPAITDAVLDDVKALADADRRLLRELFHACDQYRYTPEHTSLALASLIPKVKSALAILQQIPDDGGAAGKNVLQGVGVILLLLAGAIGARADTVSDTFLQANKLYEEGKYSQAAAMYDGLIRDAHVSPAIYFNAGNAWFKAGQVGRAIYDYRRAEQLAPRDPDIRANLEIARAKAGTNSAALPGSRWTRWVGRVTLNEWAWSASAAAAVFFLALAARQISPAFGKSSGSLIGVLAAATVWLLICLGFSINQQLMEKSSIVMVPEAVVRRGPLEESQSAFTAHDGAELMVLGRNGEWLQVSDASRQIGWLQAKDVAQMP